MVTYLIHVTGQIVAVLLLSTTIYVISSLSTENVGSPYCEIGKEYYFIKRQICKTCPKCSKAPDFKTYHINVSEINGALDCYPCYCKPGKKAYNPSTQRCDRCKCGLNSRVNTSVEILTDRYNGGLNCYECQCLPHFFSNYRTHHQCVRCIDCSKKNRIYDKKCSPDNDAECGKCLDGFMKPRFDNLPCVKNTTEVVSTVPMIMATKIRDDNFQITSPTSNGHKSEIILRIILIICSFICLGIFYMLYKMFQLPCCNENFNPSSTFTSGETISARSLIKKDETNTTNSTHGSITPLLTTLQFGSAEIDRERTVHQEVLAIPDKSSVIVVANIRHANSVQIGDGNNTYAENGNERQHQPS